MSVMRTPSPLLKRLSPVIRRSPPIMIMLILLLAIPIAALTFQFPGTSRVQQRRQKHVGVDSRVLRSGLLPSASASASVVSSAFRIPDRRFPRRPSSLFSSYPPFMRQESVEAETKSRDMGSLSDWARRCQVVFADGIELTEDALGDWSLISTKFVEQGTPVLTVPSQVILTSVISGDSFMPYYNEKDMENICAWMETELEKGSQSKQDYLPEYMLVYKLIREVYLGSKSRWYDWWKSLPTTFSTGLYLDEVERNHVERMTGDFIRVQGLQFKACLELFQKLLHSNSNESPIPTEIHQWMLGLEKIGKEERSRFDDLVKWAFTIVFTRSWRSPDRQHAQIVPLGDLANHDSQLANLKPGFRQTDGAFQFFVTNDVDADGPVNPLYLSYGLTYVPARYLVLFGFCDVTAGYIDANLVFVGDNDSGKWPTTLEPSELVISTTNGALAEEVWLAFLYKVLEVKEPEVLSEIREAFAGGDKARGNKFLEHVLETWECEVGMEIQSHYQRLLETDFTPISVTKNDLAEHPNLSMIINYNLFVRETYLSVLEHVNMFLTQYQDFQEMSASGAKMPSGKLGTEDSTSEKKSILHFKYDSNKKATEILEFPTEDTLEKKLPTISLRPEGESASATNSTTAKHEDNAITERPPTSNFSGQMFQEQTNSSIGNLYDESYSNLASQDLNSESYNYGGNQPEDSISVGKFDPQYDLKPTLKSPYANSNPRVVGANPLGEKSNSTAPPNISNDSQSGLNITPTFPSGKSNFESYSNDQALQMSDQIETPNTPLNFNSQFNSGSSPASLYGNPNSIKQLSQAINSTEKIPGTVMNQYSQNFLNTTSKNSERTSNTPSYSLDQSSKKINSTTTSNFPAGNIYPQPFSVYGTPKSQSISPDRSLGGSDSTESSRFPAENTGSQYYPEVHTTRPIDAVSTPGSDNEKNDLQSNFMNMPNSSQETYDQVTAYTKSLLSDQRGDPNREQLIEDSTKVPPQGRQNAFSTATTYAEYLQQRQALSSDGVDRSPFDESSFDGNPIGDANAGTEGDAFNSPSVGEYDYGGDFHI
eukprot:jgi/Psemu1/45402/gm1.45402_g